MVCMKVDSLALNPVHSYVGILRECYYIVIQCYGTQVQGKIRCDAMLSSATTTPRYLRRCNLLLILTLTR